jgi:hypothetical protein
VIVWSTLVLGKHSGSSLTGDILREPGKAGSLIVGRRDQTKIRWLMGMGDGQNITPSKEKPFFSRNYPNDCCEHEPKFAQLQETSNSHRLTKSQIVSPPASLTLVNYPTCGDGSSQSMQKHNLFGNKQVHS